MGRTSARRLAGLCRSSYLFKNLVTTSGLVDSVVSRRTPENGLVLLVRTPEEVPEEDPLPKTQRNHAAIQHPTQNQTLTLTDQVARLRQTTKSTENLHAAGLLLARAQAAQ